MSDGMGYAADALTIHNENIPPLGVEKNIGSVVYFMVAGYTLSHT